MSGSYAGYILGAYAVTSFVLGYLIIEGWLGLKRAKARLFAIKQQNGIEKGDAS